MKECFIPSSFGLICVWYRVHAWMNRRHAQHRQESAKVDLRQSAYVMFK